MCHLQVTIWYIRREGAIWVREEGFFNVSITASSWNFPEPEGMPIGRKDILTSASQFLHGIFPSPDFRANMKMGVSFAALVRFFKSKPASSYLLGASDPISTSPLLGKFRMFHLVQPIMSDSLVRYIFLFSRRRSGFFKISFLFLPMSCPSYP